MNQYVAFTRICNEQVKLHGRTRKAVLETVRICRDADVLREYLESREKEVVDIMTLLYDDEEILTTYVNRRVREAVGEAVDEAMETEKANRKAEKLNMVKTMLKDGTLSLEKIAVFTGVPLGTVQDLANQG